MAISEFRAVAGSAPIRRVGVSLGIAAALLLAWPTLATAQAAGASAPHGVMLPDFADLVEQVGPSVVKIRTTAKPAATPEGVDPDMQEFFRRFFGVPMPNVPGAPGQRRKAPQQPDDNNAEPQTRGVGSGFIYAADGYVMTNAHVVEGAEEVFVTLTDKREFKARVIGADKRTDVAIVKIDGKGLPSVKIGDVNRLRVGEWVVAIGAPFGLDNTVTAGIVSAKARDTGDFVPLIQTDVAINPGNSGGPLLNLRGEVVGINSQIYSRSGGYMGISFAIPMDEATRVAEQLRSVGRVVRGRIGVGITDISKDVAESLGLPKPTGAQVTAVEAGGPAEKSGLEAGDIILKFDGKTIEKAEDLRRTVGGTKPGTKSSLQVLRRGGTKDLSVTVGELDAEPRSTKATDPEPKAAPQVSVAALGLTLADLNDAKRRELKLTGKQGVLVQASEGPASRAGLAEGDVILQIGNTEVASAAQFEAALAKLDKSKPVSVLFRRGEWSQIHLDPAQPLIQAVFSRVESRVFPLHGKSSAPLNVASHHSGFDGMPGVHRLWKQSRP